jgi:hypothetical protein
MALLGEIDRSVDLPEIYLQQIGSDMKLWFKAIPTSIPSATTLAIRNRSNSLHSAGKAPSPGWLPCLNLAHRVISLRCRI